MCSIDPPPATQRSLISLVLCVAMLPLPQSDAGPVPAVQLRGEQHQTRPGTAHSSGGGVAGGCGDHPGLPPSLQISEPPGGCAEGFDEVEVTSRQEVEVIIKIACAQSLIDQQISCRKELDAPE